MEIEVKLTDIKIDKSHREVSVVCLNKYINVLKKGEKLKPIIIKPSEDGKYLLVDGLHRFSAIQMLGWKTINAKIIEGENENQVRMESE